MNRLIIGMTLLAAACNGSTTSTGPTGEDNGCTNTIISGSEFPGIGETGAYYRTTVEAKLQEEEATASIALSNAAGAVAGTPVVDGKRLIFTPDAPLEASTTYTVTVSYCAGEPAWDFTTSEVGSPTDEAGLNDNTYSLDLASGRFVQPEGVGPLLQEYLTTAILIGVQDASGGQIQMIGAVAEEGTNPAAQGECSPTIPFPTADFAGNPYFSVGPETTSLSIEGYDITVNDLFVSGAFSPDGSYIAGAVLSGSIDTRPLVPLLNPEGEDDEICNLAQTIGVSCEPCTDGGNFCLSLYVDSISAEQVTGTVLEAKHTPATVDPPEGSTDICTLDACSSDEACAQ